MRPNQYLRCYDTTRSIGWLVQFGQLENGWLANKFFNRTKYKNPRAAAIRFRNAEIKRLNYPTDGRAKTIKSETGIPGLSIMLSSSKGSILYYWQASFRGKRKWFSINIHGYSGAFQKALRWRKDQAGEPCRWQKAPIPVRPGLIEWMEARDIKC